MSNNSAFDSKATPGKNGYELRSELIAMSKHLLENEYKAKWEEWTNVTAAVDPEGNLVADNNMPVFPTADDVLATAEKFYTFVNKRH